MGASSARREAKGNGRGGMNRVDIYRTYIYIYLSLSVYVCMYVCMYEYGMNMVYM